MVSGSDPPSSVCVSQWPGPSHAFPQMLQDRSSLSEKPGCLQGEQNLSVPQKTFPVCLLLGALPPCLRAVMRVFECCLRLVVFEEFSDILGQIPLGV